MSAKRSQGPRDLLPALLRYALLVPLAYIAACLAAGLIAAAGLAGYPEFSGRGLIGLALAVAIPAALFMLMPMLMVVFIVEALRVRSLAFWLAFGGVAGLAAQIGDALGAEPTLTGTRSVLFVIAGLGGGAVFWLIAGRRAGVPREETG
ncbi:MAG: hypothetical protein ACRED5_09905 [Propylenella sp.]